MQVLRRGEGQEVVYDDNMGRIDSYSFIYSFDNNNNNRVSTSPDWVKVVKK